MKNGNPARIGLPEEKRKELIKLLTEVLDAQYPTFIRLEKIIGKLGWWAAIDGHTQKKIEPTSWRPASDDEDDDA